MASTRKVKGRDGYQVRWREPGDEVGIDGKRKLVQRTRMCPTAKVRDEFKAEVERCEALGIRWEPHAAHPPADLNDGMKAYVLECLRRRKQGTVERIVFALELFKRFAAERGGITRTADLSREAMREFYAWLALPRTSRHGKQARSKETICKNTGIVQRMWVWLHNQDETKTVPTPKLLDLEWSVPTVVVAPTWAEMDACIAACETEWHRQLATLMRFTGLRVHQAMHIEWRDIDVEHATLRVRPELGKTKKEMRGRVVPLSPHFVEILCGWGMREGFVVKSNRRGQRSRIARPRDMDRAWTRGGVRPEAWKGSPHHSFRDGFVSGLKKLGADDEAVEHLVGHSLGLRERYLDADALPLRHAVGLIPPLASPAKVIPLKVAS
jgi:integrase